MAQTNVSKEFAAPLEKVWATVVDLQHWKDWNTLLTQWKSEVPETIEVGTSVTAVLTVMGMANTITLTVDALEPEKSLQLSGTGMAGAKITLTLSVSGDGQSSTVDTRADFVSQMMVGAIGAAIERAAKKELEASLVKFGQKVQ